MNTMKTCQSMACQSTLKHVLTVAHLSSRLIALWIWRRAAAMSAILGPQSGWTKTLEQNNTSAENFIFDVNCEPFECCVLPPSDYLRVLEYKTADDLYRLYGEDAVHGWEACAHALGLSCVEFLKQRLEQVFMCVCRKRVFVRRTVLKCVEGGCASMLFLPLISLISLCPLPCPSRLICSSFSRCPLPRNM